MAASDDLTRLEATGCRLLADLQRQASLDEATGILARWGECGSAQAREGLRTVHGRGGEDAEAARVIAVTNADAQAWADPDWN